MDSKSMALMSALCFGINPILLAGGLQSNSPALAVSVGLLSGLGVLILLVPWLGGFQFDQLTARATAYFVLGGFFGVVLGRSALYMGIKHLGSTRASTIKNGAPVITALLALAFLHETIELERWGGIVLVTIGLMIVGNMISRHDLNRVTWSGVVFASLTPISYGIRPIFSKIGLNLSPLPLAATLISYLTALFCYAGYFVFKRRSEFTLLDKRGLEIGRAHV